MKEQINVSKIMEELREVAKTRKYDREAMDFEFVAHVESLPCAMVCTEELQNMVNDLQMRCNVNYDRPIEGKGKLIKKIIKKLYCFHIKPLWQEQNRINQEMSHAIIKLKDYLVQENKEQARLENEIRYLKTRCEGYEVRLSKLEATKEKGE